MSDIHYVTSKVYNCNMFNLPCKIVSKDIRKCIQ